MSHRWNLNCGKSELIQKNRNTLRYREETLGYLRGKEGRDELVVWDQQTQA